MLDSRLLDLEQPEIWPVDKRKALDFATRYMAMRKSGGKCPYCGTELQFEHEYGARVAFDHIIPISRGGADDISNLIAACYECNADKRAKTGLEYICEREGIAVHWFARFNPELDGFSAPDSGYDLWDRDAWFACWPEVWDGDVVDYDYDAYLPVDEEEEFQHDLETDMATLVGEGCI